MACSYDGRYIPQSTERKWYTSLLLYRDSKKINKVDFGNTYSVLGFEVFGRDLHSGRRCHGCVIDGLVVHCSQFPAFKLILIKFGPPQDS